MLSISLPLLVQQMIELLSKWKPLPPEEALELLDYEYQHPDVRLFAVNSLEELL